ncbi:hypothetical protein EYS14_19650 [Alteromonadaceae bacterium M269]|nr:hypothetical protein EYS14_19650 [Alteromonadaceae bacterium M269]
MHKALSNLYTLGDFDTLREYLLHSSRWLQHNFTAFGYAQIEKQWLETIELLGDVSLTTKTLVPGEHFDALLLIFSNKEKNQTHRLGLILEHNETHIKQVHCIADIDNDNTAFSLTEKLPDADPLHINQFDHQLHPCTSHAKPTDLLGANGKEHLDNWWHLWQANQLASFTTCYESNAKITLAGKSEKLSVSDLRHFKIKLVNQFKRSYAQLERLCFDEKRNVLACTWQLDGDYVDAKTAKRVRINIMSFVQFSQHGQVAEECILIDWAALEKRFALEKAIEF